jgi:hypothetical protein
VAKPALVLSGVHAVVVAGMDPGEASTELDLPLVGVDDVGPVVRIAFQYRSQVILPTRDRLTVPDDLEAYRTAAQRGGRAVGELRAHRVLDFDDAYAAGRAAATRPAFRFSLGIDESGGTRPDRLTAFNLLLHHRPQDRIVYLEHDYEAPELWGEPGGYTRVLLEPGQTWTDEQVHVLPTHRVGDATFAYRLGRRLTGGAMAVNLKPGEDALSIARQIGAVGLQYVHYVYRVSDEMRQTPEGPAAVATASWKIAVPGAVNGSQNLPFAPLLVAAVTDRLDHLATLVDVHGVEFTAYEKAVSGGSGVVYAPVLTLSAPQPPQSAPRTGTDVLPPAAPTRKRWGRR